MVLMKRRNKNKKVIKKLSVNFMEDIQKKTIGVRKKIKH